MFQHSVQSNLRYGHQRDRAKCPYKRGHNDDVTFMTPLIVLSVQELKPGLHSSLNWFKFINSQYKDKTLTTKDCNWGWFWPILYIFFARHQLETWNLALQETCDMAWFCGCWSSGSELKSECAGYFSAELLCCYAILMNYHNNEKAV